MSTIVAAVPSPKGFGLLKAPANVPATVVDSSMSTSPDPGHDDPRGQQAAANGLTEIEARQSTPAHLGVACGSEPPSPAISAPTRPRLSPTLPQALLSPPPSERPASSRGTGSSQTSRRFAIALWKPRTYHRWKSPALVVVFFLIGFGMSLCHCVFYPSLIGQIKHMAVPKGTARQADNAYFGFVPTINNTDDLVALSEPRYQEPSNAANELWMTFQRYVLNSKGDRIRTRAWQVCRLHNATYDLRLEWDRGIQNVTGSYGVREEVGFPRDRPGEVSDMASHAYAAFMWALMDQLVGSFAWLKQENISGTDTNLGLGRAAQFGLIESPIQQTSILGSVDLDVFFDFNAIYGLYASDNETDPSGQRLQDKALARNRTLAVLVEELSFNITVTLLHNRLLTYNSTREVTRWNDVNRYGYLATSLFIPYALANLIAFAALVLGMVSFLRHETFPTKTFQDIASAAADPHVIRIMQEST
ncbi:hypothetical protein BGZ61DRAFT_541812 [Ilyonectria robusta]|uniref:uncharacterized protein n=1 Tax=Ilyonectria robusta TaxID=1079257 RepID=UPI001E8CE1C7|nr:uncharacterized protein BGZ61DRAFT_541812 [Ilyonectria robusta]KAH8652840.1 hypothetical protein BGZ61DRAFT_541812 [Ilyonectria robusta]